MSFPARLLATASLACLLAVGALAQPAPPTRLRGTVVSLDGATLVVATREGPRVTVALAEPLTVLTVRPVALDAIAPNSFIGTATEPGADGEPQAIEVLVFPEAARGSGEGHYAWDLTPGSSMTNATVTATVQGTAGRELSLAYRGGTMRVRVPEGVPVVTFAPATRSDLVAGAPVFIAATRGADGRFGAGRVVVGTNGVAPPM